jgi:hypothetical protein
MEARYLRPLKVRGISLCTLTFSAGTVYLQPLHFTDRTERSNVVSQAALHIARLVKTLFKQSV